jgi:hypothetical protein
VPPRPSAAKRVESHFVSTPREAPAAEFEARRRAVQDYHQRLLAEMQARHELERRADSLGRPREKVLMNQELERRAFEEQRRRELEAVPRHSNVLHRKRSLQQS